jgi:hypothetical protein
LILIDQTITVIIDPIADLNLTVRDAEISITGIPNAVTICVFLKAVEDLGAVVTGITDPVLIFIELVRVRDVRAVIFGATETVAISVNARAAE